MAKKKDKETTFTPSKYQSDIFDFIQHGVGNLVIEAAAGSGKTSTLIKALDFIGDDKKILFCSFNSDIVKELKKKVPKGKTNVDIRTVHSLGYMMLRQNFKNIDFKINETKYKSHIFSCLPNYASFTYKRFNKSTYNAYVDNICRLVDFMRYNLVYTPKQCEEIIDRYEIILIDDEVNVAFKILEWGKNNITEVDFGDLVWIPNVLNLSPRGLQFDFVFGDEAQDFSIAQKDLLLKCAKLGTRFIFCGDKNQCIYSFASASPETFDKLKCLPNTTSLPLSISYRCGKKIVDFAQHIVPSIEPNPTNQDGDVVYEVSLDDVADGDMVICRNNSPLIKAYSKLILQNKKCIIRGKDIGINLKKMVKDTQQTELNPTLNKDGVFVRLYAKVFDERNKLIQKTGLDEKNVMEMPVIANKIDMIRALEILSADINSSDEIIAKIESIFSDKASDGITLSTIHKAKGLEANNVYVLCNSIMPSKCARQQWEIEQEHNLQYVAYTRAKNILGFISESEVNAIQNDTNDLAKIEACVSRVLNTKFTIDSMPVGLATVIAAKAKDDLSVLESTSNKATISDSKRKAIKSIGDLIRKRPNKRIKSF